MKEKQGGLIPTGLKRWPLKHLTDATCVLPSPAGPAGLVPKVITALCAASQLPGKGPTDVEDAPAPAHYSLIIFQ